MARRSRSSGIDLADALSSALAGPRGRTGDGSIAEQVAALGGSRQAAETLGVTQRTVQRWTTTTAGQRRAPTPAVRAQLARESAPARRAASITPRREQRLRRNGAAWRLVAVQGPTVASSGTARYRQSPAAMGPENALSPESMGAILDAYLGAEDDALTDAFLAAVARDYMHDNPRDSPWIVEPGTVTQLDIRPL